jgi:hypothetical protein
MRDAPMNMTRVCISPDQIDLHRESLRARPAWSGYAKGALAVSLSVKMEIIETNAAAIR